ncbi:MAG: hypothetical protein QXP36_11510 [Conexivisphaerales archaeon]
MLINYVAFGIYLVLGILGLYGAVLSSQIVLIMRKYSAILKSAFFLNRDVVVHEFKFIYAAGFLLFITAIFAIMQKFFYYVFPFQSLDNLLYLLAYAFGILSLTLFFIVVYRWNGMVREYAKHTEH